MNRNEFNAKTRQTHGGSASRRSRRGGVVPGVVYSAGSKSLAIEMDHEEMMRHLAREAFHSSILTMRCDEKPVKVLLREVQTHPYRRQILHLDFMHVDENKAITIDVPLHFINAENSPGVKSQGGLVSHVFTELKVSCLPKDLPEFIQVDLKDLSLGHSFHVSQISLPNGVKAVLQKDTDPVVVTILKAKVEEEAPAAPVETVVTAQKEATPAAADKDNKDKDPSKKSTDGKK